MSRSAIVNFGKHLSKICEENNVRCVFISGYTPCVDGKTLQSNYLNTISKQSLGMGFFGVEFPGKDWVIWTSEIPGDPDETQVREWFYAMLLEGLFK
jgi:hypothetical protein